MNRIPVPQLVWLEIRRRSRDFLGPFVSIGLLVTVFTLQDARVAGNAVAVFEFAAPCRQDTRTECLHFHWPGHFGAARVALPFVSRPVITGESEQTAMIRSSRR